MTRAEYVRPTNKWVVHRPLFRYVVAFDHGHQWESFIGRFARNDEGHVVWFWSRDDAQQMADMLNQSGDTNETANPK